MPGKEIIALQLQEAKEGLESQLREALRLYEQHIKGPLQFNMNLEDERSGTGDDLTDHEREVRGRIRTLVDSFHNSDVVSRTGMRVYSVTAIDSDRDGEIALNVKYEYREDPGMGKMNLSPETRHHLPSTSAGPQESKENEEND